MASQLRAQRSDFIGPGAGEADFTGPEHVANAVIETIQRGDRHSTAVGGTVALKQAIVDRFETVVE